MFADLSGKIAIITGSGQGIGAGIARVFAGAGSAWTHPDMETHPGVRLQHESERDRQPVCPR